MRRESADPRLQGVPWCLRDLELHRALRLVLHDDGARRHLVSMRNVPDLQGAMVAAPDRPAIAYVGDGAWGISFNEMLTCVREKIGVTVVLFNNGQWVAEKKNHVDF